MRRAWIPWVIAAFAVALAISVVRRGHGENTSRPLVIGDHVAIIAEPAARYRLAEASADAARVVVQRGTVTARLWPTGQLVLEGGGVVVTAAGGVCSLTVRESNAVVHAERGTAEVRDAQGVHVLAEGTSWPTGARTPDPYAAAKLSDLADRGPPGVAASRSPGPAASRSPEPAASRSPGPAASPSPEPTGNRDQPDRGSNQ